MKVLIRVLAAALALTAPAVPAAPPNIVLIFTDDQGYQDIGCFGSPLIKTPNLDRMAEEGRKFTSFYSASSVCSPSRAGLLTGCYPVRVGVPRVLFPGTDTGLNPDETTSADLLKAKGYATACIGKWHLGHQPNLLPTRHGFDRYFGIPYSNDMSIDPAAPIAEDAVLRDGMTVEKIRAFKMKGLNSEKRGAVPLMRNEEVIEYPVDQSQLTLRYTDEAVKFITANKDRPFFLYLPHTMPHIPLYASEKFKGKSERGLYGDTIEEIDWSTGRILETIGKLGLDEKTLVIFTSDNGPWKLRQRELGGNAEPLRGFKFQTYEGGMRVPCIMRWPGTIPAGTTCNRIAATIDLLPTFAGLAGVALPADRVIDGSDITALLTGEVGANPRDTYFYYAANKTEIQAVRQGKWKLRLDPKDGEQLYDLQSDIGETTNLADAHAELVSTLRKLMADFDAELKAHSRPPGQGKR